MKQAFKFAKFGKFVFLLLFFLSLLFVSLHAEASSVAFAKGQAAFGEANFQKALPLFQQAHKEDPANLDPVYMLGVTYLQLKDYANASKYLKELLDKKPDFSKAYFEYGFSLYRQKHYGEALTWLQKAQNKDPKNPLPGFYASLAQYYLGQKEVAVATLKTATHSTANMQVANSAEEWIKNIESGTVPNEAMVQPQEEEFKKWFVRAATSFFYDSNVILDPDELNIAGFQSEQADFMEAGALDLTYLLYHTKNGKLFVEYSGYQSAYDNVYFDFDRFNFGRHTFGIDYFYSISDKVRWRMPLNGTFVNLGLSKYVMMGSGASYFDVAWNDELMTTFYGKFRRDDYFAQPSNFSQIRDASQPDFGIEQYYFFPGKKNQYIKMGYDFAVNYSVGSDWDYVSHRVIFAYSTPVIGKLSFLTVNEIIPLRKFRHVDSVFSVRRGDFSYNSTNALTYEFNKNLSLAASYSYYSTESNIDFYTYHRHVTGLTLTTQF